MFALLLFPLILLAATDADPVDSRMESCWPAAATAAASAAAEAAEAAAAAVEAAEAAAAAEEAEAAAAEVEAAAAAAVAAVTVAEAAAAAVTVEAVEARATATAVHSAAVAADAVAAAEVAEAEVAAAAAAAAAAQCIRPTNGDYGVVIAGGNNGPDVPDVEVWSPHSPSSCQLPDLPYPNVGLTLDYVQGKLVSCGGSSDSDTAAKSKCHILDEGPDGPGWRFLTKMLIFRNYHTSAMVEDTVLLVGGHGLNTGGTTEWVPVDGSASQLGFAMSPRRSRHCSIQVADDGIVLVGGEFTWQLVEHYFNLRPMEEPNKQVLPSLIWGRGYHACGQYLDSNRQILIVTGGISAGQHLLTGAEIYDFSLGAAGSWQQITAMPSPRYQNNGATISGIFYSIGGTMTISNAAFDGSDYLEWSNGLWTHLGNMTVPRRFLGTAVVALDDITNFCQ